MSIRRTVIAGCRLRRLGTSATSAAAVQRDSATAQIRTVLLAYYFTLGEEWSLSALTFCRPAAGRRTARPLQTAPRTLPRGGSHLPC